jgi:hypothetical protein
MENRKTSIDCYHQIKDEGLLSKRRLQVYEALYKKAPCTSLEAMKSVLNSNNTFSQSRARVTELRELGVIYEKGVKKCSVSGRTAIEWDLTDNIPIGKKAPLTKKQKINLVLNSLRELYKKGIKSTDNDWKTVAELIINL